MMSTILLAVLGILATHQCLVNAAAPGCCDFEISSTCTVTGSWMSGTFPVSAAQPPSGSATNVIYMYNNSAEVSVLSDTSVNNDYTVITFDYYFYTTDYNSGSYLHVFFQPDGATYKSLVGDIYLPIDNWFSARFPCNDPNNLCCGPLTSTCIGTFTIFGALSNGPPVHGLFGIDNIGTCETPEPCCQLESVDNCGFTNVPANVVDWQSSSLFMPIYPIPNPGSNYLFFEFSGYNVVNALVSEIASEEISILNAFDFTARIYAFTQYNDLIQSNLVISFRESVTGTNTDLATIENTAGWSPISFSCAATGQDCCVGQPSCGGRLVFTATVTGNIVYPQSVAYAIDSVGENGYC